jgi:YD repeat-containing protein
VANCLNQYTTFTYDIDGNLLSDETYSYSYDVANQLKTVSANGVMLLTNDYDSKSRRVRKVTPAATTTYFYDDWNLIEEYIAYTNGNTSITHYYWGKDLSGSFQGAGGVGGLLYLTIDGSTFVPLYDNNGNITHYLDSNGNVVAQYTYDAFGNIIAQSGLLANTFRHRVQRNHHFNKVLNRYYIASSEQTSK